MAEPNDWQDVDDWQDVPEGGEGGRSGNDAQPRKPYVEPERRQMGSPRDAVKAAYDTAFLSLAPQIDGAIGMVTQDARNLLAGEPLHPKTTPLDAYRSTRDASQASYDESENTWWGKAGQALGIFAPGLPTKALPKGAGTIAKAKQGAKVGGLTGGVQAAADSEVDLTKADNGWEQYAQLLKDTGWGVGGGVVGGGVAGGTLGKVEKPARDLSRRLPMDMIGVTTPGRRAMERQGIYDESGDALLSLVKPFRSGMRAGTLVPDALEELSKRGKKQGAAEAAIDAAAPAGVQTSGAMHDALKKQADPYRLGTTEDALVSKRLDREASKTLDSIGSTDPEIGARIPLAEAEAFKQRFGPQAAKRLKMAAEPAAKTTALGEAYTALRKSNEAAAEAVDPALADTWKKAKRDYGVLAAPLQAAGVDRSGMEAGDFDLGTLLSEGAAEPGSLLSKLGEVPGAGLVKVPLDLAGRAYGRGTVANIAEVIAKGAERNSGGNVGGRLGASGASMVQDKLEPWLQFLEEEKP